MDWNKILEAGGFKISEGQYCGKDGDGMIWTEPSISVDASTDFDDQDIAVAIVRSLEDYEADEDQKRKKVVGNESQLEEDEQLARALQESLNMESPPRHDAGNIFARTLQGSLNMESPPQHDAGNIFSRALQGSLNMESPPRHDAGNIFARARQGSSNMASPPRHDAGNIFSRALQGSSNMESPPRHDAGNIFARALQGSSNMESPPRHDAGNIFSRALQGSLNMESPPRSYAGNIFQPSTFFSPGFRVCAGCNCEIGHEKHLRRMDADWHPECFRCHACGLCIFDLEFSTSGNRPYHESCYKDQNHPRCNVCKKFIPTNADGETEYRKHPFWLQEYCPSHEDDGTPRCCSCERTEVRDTRYLSLDDGRKLCLECLNSAIMDTLECQPLYLEIQEFYEGLNMKVEQQIPLLLVERQALNEAMEGEKSGHHLLPETRGLCLSEEQTVSTISRRPRIGTGHRFIDMMTEPCRLVRQCEVTAILILYGLPRLLTGTILAHEMMHAWLKLKGYPNLSQDVEEGICQVLAYMWLDSEIHSSSGNDVASASTSLSSSTSQKGARSLFEKKLGKFFKHQIESDRSPAYGDGFRAGNQAVQKYGLKSTLDHIRLTRSFPY